MRAMRFVRTTIVAASIGGVLGAGPARAGGGVWFEFDGNESRADYLAVRKVVTGEMAAYFNDRELESVQFYAYLEPASRAGGRWGAPHLSPAARLLGPISLGPFRKSYVGYRAQATVTFTVPRVAPGRYVIEYCNSPCTEALGEPDANWDTAVTIVATRAEARLNHRIDRLDSELRSEMWRDDSWERRHIKDLSGMIKGPRGLASYSEMLRDQGQAALRRVDELEAQVGRLSAKVQAAGTAWLAYALGAVALAALAIIVLRTGRKPTEVKVRLVEQSDPTFRSWELVREDDRDRVISDAS